MQSLVSSLMNNLFCVSLVFVCRENPRRSGILLLAYHPRFCRYIGYSPEVYQVCERFCDYEFGGRDAMVICDIGTGAQQFRGLVMSEIHRERTLTSLTPGTNLGFHFSGMIDYRRNLGRVGKINCTHLKDSWQPCYTAIFLVLVEFLYTWFSLYKYSENGHFPFQS